MAELPLALSAHGFVNSVGAYAGVASIVGLALLILLYFVHARETATLRERALWLEEQVRSLEDRIAAPRRAPPPSLPGGPADVAGPPVPAFRPAAAATGIRPASALAGLAVPAGRAVAPAPAVARSPAAPMGSGAPALAAATRAVAGLPGPGGPAPVAASPMSAPALPEPAQEDRAAIAVGGGTLAERAARPVTAAGGGSAVATSRPLPPAPPPPPRSLAPPRPASPSRPGGRGEDPLGYPAEPETGRGSSSRPRSGRVLAGAVVALLVAAAVVVLVLVTAGGTGNRTRATVTPTTNAPVTVSTGAARRFNPATVTVAVLNGTSTAGLAHRIAVKLQGDGYRPGAVVTAPDQTLTATIIGFLPGSRAAALQVAKALRLGSSSVQPIDAATQAVACPPPAACAAQVVATVGADLAATA